MYQLVKECKGKTQLEWKGKEARILDPSCFCRVGKINIATIQYLNKKVNAECCTAILLFSPAEIKQ